VLFHHAEAGLYAPAQAVLLRLPGFDSPAEEGDPALSSVVGDEGDLDLLPAPGCLAPHPVGDCVQLVLVEALQQALDPLGFPGSDDEGCAQCS